VNDLLIRLTEERRLLETFIELLDEETEALINSDLAGLPALTERKAQLATRISAADHDRKREEKRLGSRTDSVACGDEALQHAWHELRERAAQVREHNYRNGVLIHTHLNFTRESINFLRANGKPLYGPDGQHQLITGYGASIASG